MKVCTRSCKRSGGNTTQAGLDSLQRSRMANPLWKNHLFDVSPKYVGGLADGSAQQLLLRGLAASERSVTLSKGVLFGLLHKLICGASSPLFGAEREVLQSVVVNGQYPQAHLHRASLTETAFCTLCCRQLCTLPRIVCWCP